MARRINSRDGLRRYEDLIRSIGPTGGGGPGSTGPTGPHGITGPAGATSGLIYYLHSEVSDIGTYQKLLPSPADDPETSNTVAVDSVSGEVLLKSFVTEPGDPGTTLIPAASGCSLPGHLSIARLGSLNLSLESIREALLMLKRHYLTLRAYVMGIAHSRLSRFTA